MDNKLIPNSTQIPNVILDYIMPRIPLAESMCLLYICRRTFGFHKDEDRISFTQFIDGIKSRDGKVLDNGTGLVRQSVSMALKTLEYSGAIIIGRNTSGNKYKINLDMDVEEVVQKIDQYRKQTAISLKNRPKQVKLLYLQKKEKQRETKSDTLLEIFHKEIKTEDLEEVKKFIDYWTEKNIKGTKEKWQMEKTFDVKRRWAKWNDNILTWKLKGRTEDTTNKVPYYSGMPARKQRKEWTDKEGKKRTWIGYTFLHDGREIPLKKEDEKYIEWK